jgi:two-component system CheB/CheR fusion protein
MQKKKVEKNMGEMKRYPIVAIGASAGGLEAIRELLTNLRPDTGMAYVYIQHLDPTHKSMLSDILQRVTRMKVFEAENLLRIQPNQLYIIPPNKDMAIVEGILMLNERLPKPSIHLPIDKFFSSLAEKQKEAAIGIVLSGNANDGTYGLKVIKQAGGLTFAQDDSAKFPSMPHSAIAEGVVDLVLSPKEIAKELERISQHPAIPSIVQEEAIAIADEQTMDTDLTLSAILMLLKKGTGVDFSHYKTNTIKRRIIRRMLIYKLETLDDYLTYLKEQPGEVHVLYQDILINVTSFFRDQDTMEYAKKTLIPNILKQKKVSDIIRVWVPACASGEEVYSLAIVFMEVCEDKARNCPLQIFASDLSELSIAKARLGIYSKSELAEVSAVRLNRFFEPVDGGYRIVKSIRDLSIFATHNVLKDPPFSRLDLISCCNLMIYLDNSLQKKIISIFHYALIIDGILMLGKSESISTAPSLFHQIEKKYKVYSKTNDAPNQQIFNMHFRLRNAEQTETIKERGSFVDTQKKGVSLEKTIDDILLSEYIPPSVVVNYNLDILQFRGVTSLFIEPSSGKASLNLLKMARNGLSYEIRNLVHNVAKTGQRIKKNGLEIKIKKVTHHISIEVIPLKSRENEDELFFIIFEEMLLPSTSENTPSLTKNKIVKQLQNELSVAKEDMHSIIEEQEANVEELQSANEEIISSNEELQSINEELETSKEEVESANEELQTINSELQVRNEQLSESYEYSEAVFETIDEAVLVLTKDFRVKSANKAFYNIFKVSRHETEGSLLYELGNGQWNILNFRELLENVVSGGKTIHGFEIEHDFPHVGKKIMLLNARRIIQEVHRQHLVILAIRDITEHRQAQKIIAEQEARFRNMANNVPVMIWTQDVNESCNFMNKTRLEFTGRSMESEMGAGWMEDFHKDDLISVMEAYSAHIRKKTPFKLEYRLRRRDGEYRWVTGEGNPNYAQDGEFIGYIVYCIEIHDKKLAQVEIEKKVGQRTSELKIAMSELAISNTELGQFAYAASHDLQEPIRKIITYSDRLQKSDSTRTDEDQGYVDKILSSAERMRKLISDLLNMTKLSVSDRKFEEVDLNVMMAAVLRDLDLAIDEKKVQVSIKTLPPVYGLPIQLHQLFYNLVANAIKFSNGSTAPFIEISAKKMTSAAVRLHPDLLPSIYYTEITFRDNGIGFKQEFADQIFTIFQRLNTNGSAPGSGIGLALCRKIVTNHKGIIFAESRSGEGASFFVVLPLEMPDLTHQE